MSLEHPETTGPGPEKTEIVDELGAADAERAARFWSRPQPINLAEAMKKNMESSMRYHQIGVLVDADGVTEEQEEMMSAYRVLAKESGYEIGEFQVSPANSNAALASIRRKQLH